MKVIRIRDFESLLPAPPTHTKNVFGLQNREKIIEIEKVLKKIQAKVEMGISGLWGASGDPNEPQLGPHC